MFGLTPWSYEFAHSWSGVLTADVVAGVVLTLLWVLLVRDAMAAAAPAQSLPRQIVISSGNGLRACARAMEVLKGGGSVKCCTLEVRD